MANLSKCLKQGTFTREEKRLARDISFVEGMVSQSEEYLSDVENSIRKQVLTDMWEDLPGNEGKFSPAEIREMGKAAEASRKEIADAVKGAGLSAKQKVAEKIKGEKKEPTKKKPVKEVPEKVKEEEVEEVTPETGRAFILEDAVAAIAKTKTFQEAKPILQNMADSIIEKGMALKDFTVKMKNSLGDLFTQFRNRMRALYNQAKRTLGKPLTGPEVGAVGDIPQGTTTARGLTEAQQKKLDHILGVPAQSETVSSGNNTDPTDLSKSRFEMEEDGRGRKYFDSFVYHIQDQFNSVEKIQTSIEDHLNDKLPESQDVVLANTTFHGKVQDRIDKFEDAHLEPLLNAIQQSEHEWTDVEAYAHAKHAFEANERLKRINLVAVEKKTEAALNKILEQEGGLSEAETDKLFAELTKDEQAKISALSGMKDQEAQEILDKFAGDKEMQSLHKRLMTIRKMTRDLYRSGGLEKGEVIDKWEAAYDNQVPLMREGKKNRSGTGGSGFSVNNKPQKLRAGSNKKVVNILANIVAQHESAIQRDEKTKLGRIVLELTEKNLNDNLWTIDEPSFSPWLEESTGQIRFSPKNEDHQDNVFLVQVDGETRRIKFNETNIHAMRMAEALNNVGVAESSALVNMLNRANNWLRFMYTSGNPEFMITNFQRDAQTALLNLSATDAKKMELRLLRNLWPALHGIRANIGLPGASKVKIDKKAIEKFNQLYDEFKEDGAQTGWIETYKDTETREKKLIRALKLIEPGTGNKVRKGAGELFDWIANENTAVENATRLAAYSAARDAGVSRKKAAALAKNLTVNFNRKGKQAWINAVWLFSNASIQANAIFLKTMAKSKTAQAMAGSIILMSALLDMRNRAIGGDDDDGISRYDKESDYIKGTNWVFMRSDGSKIIFKLPYIFNIFAVIGQEIGRALDSNPSTDKRTAIESAVRIGGAFLDAVNPIGGGSMLSTVSPTLIKPIIQISENVNFFGGKLRPDQIPGQPIPDSQLFFSGTSETSKAAAEFLNKISKGNEVRPGKIDVSPTSIDLLYDTITGGVGKIIENTITTGIKISRGEELDSRQIPFVRKFFRPHTKSYNASKFWENAAEEGLVRREFLAIDNAKDRKRFRRDKDGKLTEKGGILSLHGLVKNRKKQAKNLRNQKEQIKAKSITPAEKRKRIKKVNEQLDEIYINMNKSFNKIKEPVGRR